MNIKSIPSYFLLLMFSKVTSAGQEIASFSTEQNIPPENVSISGRYGICHPDYRIITLEEARSPTLKERLRETTKNSEWGAFTVLDGKYLSGNYGGILESMNRQESLSLGTPICVNTLKNTGKTTSGYYSNRYISSLLSSNNGKICAIFSREDSPSIAGCIGHNSGIKFNESYESLRKFITTAYLSQSTIRVYMDFSQKHYDFMNANFDTFTISAISGCYNNECL